MLNDLYRTERQGGGMRALILYPMNALVNDQMDRIYQWLKGQDRATLFHFTSETPEDAKAADRDGVPCWQGCRIRTRQQARGLETMDGTRTTAGPVPDIVITNYSMLEYMLCRPQDAVLFGSALQTIVLDEAHLYSGTLAAEITLLLRRLYERCGVGPANVMTLRPQRHWKEPGRTTCGISLRPCSPRVDSRCMSSPGSAIGSSWLSLWLLPRPSLPKH